MSGADNRPVGILGSGGHAKVILSALRALGRPAQAIFDDDPARWGQSLQGIPILGPIAEAPEALPLIAAIGDNRVRQRLAEQFAERDFITVIHPFTWIDPTARIGPGTVIFAGSLVQADTIIGRHVIINTGAGVDHDSVVGDYSHLAPGSRLAGGVNVGVGGFVGIGACAIPNVAIGEWTTVGAGATVVKDLPPNVTAVGTPARPIQRGKH